MFGVVCASLYSMGLMFPKPAADVPWKFWFSNATMPANTGAEADVPPTTDRFVSMAIGIPLAQVLVDPPLPNSESGVQKMYPGKSGDASREMSGTNRALA